MTTYSTSFDSYTVDVQPSDWTARWATASTNWLTRSKAGTQGGKVLENTGTVTAQHLLAWDAIDADANRANVEVLARMRPSTSTTELFHLTVRGSGAAGSENGYVINFLAPTSYTLRKWVAGVSTDIGNSVVLSVTAGAWYYVRLRANGTSIQGKVWKDGEVEPTAWSVSATDSAVSAAGWVGIGNRVFSNTRDCDWFSVGTNGDTAPLPTSSATEIRTSQVAVEAALATVAQARISQLITEVAISAPIAGQISQLVVEVAFSNAAAPVTQQPRMIVLI